MALVISDIIEILQLFDGIQWEEEKKICMMGKQFIWIEWKQFMGVVDHYGFKYHKKIYEELKDIYPIDAFSFFKMFGFAEVHAIDISVYEGADIMFDLNSEGKLPDNLCETFDLVIDGGTLEHVFKVHSAIVNMSGMVRQNGFIYHAVPLAGYINHGFYSISPTFFIDYYRSDFRIKELNIKFWADRNLNYEHEAWGETFSQDCRIFYHPSEINRYMRKMNDVSGDGEALLRCIAQKRRNVENTCPIQGAVMRLHENTLNNISRGKIFHFKDILELFGRIGGGIALFGAGSDCNLLLNELYKNDMENLVAYIFDKDINRAGSKYRGYDIFYPTKLKLEKTKAVFISSTRFAEEIYAYLTELNVKSVYKITDYVTETEE